MGYYFCGHGGVHAVKFANYASYCELIFVDKRHIMKSTKIYSLKKFPYIWSIESIKLYI